MAKSERAAAITDGLLMGRVTQLETEGVRIALLRHGFGQDVPALALVRDGNLSDIIVMIPYSADKSETDQLRNLVRAYDLDLMPVTVRRQ